jgi:hypothetical protein
MASFNVTGKEAEFNTSNEITNQPNSDAANTAVSLLNENIFTFMDCAYKGSGGFRTGRYLVPHSRELFYSARKGFSHYVNFVKPVVRAMVEPCFVDEAKRNYTADVVVDAFIKDVDSKKTPIQRFVHSAMNVCRRHSVVFIVVDNHSTQPIDQKTAVEKRILPYLYMRKANQLDTYRLDEYGNILEISFIERYEKVDAAGHCVQKAQYRMWNLTDTYLYVYDRDSTLNVEERHQIEVTGSRSKHNLGIVPVVICRDVELEMSDDFLPDPKLYDIARVNHSIYNKDSEIRELERNQAFAILCVQQDKRSSLTVGSSNVLFYPIGANAPQFVAPPMEVLSQLTSNREKLREDLFRLAEQNGIVAVQDAKSGLALAYEFFAHESVLQETSRIAEKMEEDIIEVFNKWTSKNIEYEVVYRSSFIPHGEESRIKLLDTVLSQQSIPKKMERDIIIDEYKLLFPRFEQDDIEELEAEFEEQDAEKADTAESFADGDNAALSPEEAAEKKAAEEAAAQAGGAGVQNIPVK